MRSFKSLGAILTAMLAVAGCAALMPFSTRAQTATNTPQIVITWRVIGGSAPSSYRGKILPVQGAPMDASVAVLNKGRVASLSSQAVYWYLDDNFIGGGAGAQTIAFGAPEHNEIISLRVEIPDYGNGLSDTAYIRMVNPQAVIASPYPNNTFATSSLSLRAIPYFFNAADLSKLVFSWTVNGKGGSTQENPQTLAINLASNAPPGYSLAIVLGVQVSGNPYVSANNNITLTAAGQ